ITAQPALSKPLRVLGDRNYRANDRLLPGRCLGWSFHLLPLADRFLDDYRLGILAGRRFSGGRLCRTYIYRCRSGEDPLSTQLVDVVVEMPRRFESELGFRMDRAS